jgi:broad specificity phosphatase PhoE
VGLPILPPSPSLASAQVNDCAGPWWLAPGQHDSAEALQERVGHFLSHLRHCGAARPVCVGHSLFFRALCAAAGPALAARRPELHRQMRAAKLDNAAALAVTVRFPDGAGDPVVEDAALLYGGFRPGKH